MTNILDYIHENPELINMIVYLKPYLSTLSRENDEELNRKFVDLVYDGKWIELDKLIYPKMNEDEKDRLSQGILVNAKKTVERIIAVKKISKIVFMKIVEYALKGIV